MTKEVSTKQPPEPPEGLANAVATAVNQRMNNPTFVTSLGILPTKVKAEDFKTVAHYAITARQRVNLTRLHRLNTPTSWGFRFEVDTPNGAKIILAAASPASSGGFNYSGILDLPEGLFSARMIEAFGTKASSLRLGVLQVPAYYLEAVWLRTEAPETDRLIFIRNTFGIFPNFPTLIPVELSVFVRYLNDRLEQGDRARPIYKDDDSVKSMD